MFFVNENLDETLFIVQEIRRIEDEAELPQHDNLFREKQEEVEAAEEESMDDPEQSEETPPEEDSSDAVPEDDEIESDEPPAKEPEELSQIGNKQSTPATESLRNDYYSRVATEAFLEEGSVSHKAAVMAGQGIGAVSRLAYGMLKEAAIYAKELGIEYGPVVFSKLRRGVLYVATRLLKSMAKLRVAVIQGYREKRYSFTRSLAKAEKLKETSSLLEGKEVSLTQEDRFIEQDFAKWLKVNHNFSIDESIKSMETLMDFLTDRVNSSIKEDVSSIASLIDHTRRGVRSSPIGYMEVPMNVSGLRPGAVTGYGEQSEVVESYTHPTVFPNNTILTMAIPRKSIVQGALKSGDISEVTKAYQDSFIVLGVSPMATRSMSTVRYMDKKELDIFVERIAQLAKKALAHVEMYKDINKSSQRLKMSYEHYFSWLTGDDHQKSLHDSMVELIYLKQAFISKVYLPAALDIHDYVAMYIDVMLKFAEENLRQLKVVQNSTD